MEDLPKVEPSSSGLSQFILVPCDREYARRIGWPDGWLNPNEKRCTTHHDEQNTINECSHPDNRKASVNRDENNVLAPQPQVPVSDKNNGNVRPLDLCSSLRQKIDTAVECCFTSSTVSSGINEQLRSQTARPKSDSVGSGTNGSNAACENKPFASRLSNEFLCGNDVHSGLLFDKLKTEMKESISETGMNLLFWKSIKEEHTSPNSASENNPFCEPLRDSCIDESKISSSNDSLRDKLSTKTLEGSTEKRKSYSLRNTKQASTCEEKDHQTFTGTERYIANTKATSPYSPTRHRIVKSLPVQNIPEGYRDVGKAQIASTHALISPHMYLETHKDLNSVRIDNDQWSDEKRWNKDMTLSNLSRTTTNFETRESNQFKYDPVWGIKREPLSLDDNDKNSGINFTHAQTINPSSSFGDESMVEESNNRPCGPNALCCNIDDQNLDTPTRMRGSGVKESRLIAPNSMAMYRVAENASSASRIEHRYDSSRDSSPNLPSTYVIDMNNELNRDLNRNSNNDDYPGIGCREANFWYNDQSTICRMQSSPFKGPSHPVDDVKESWNMQWSHEGQECFTDNEFLDNNDEDFCPSSTSGPQLLSDLSPSDSAVSLVLYESENDQNDS